MPTDNLCATYTRLDAKSRHVLQLCALSDQAVNRGELSVLSSESGWKDRTGKRLTKTAMGPVVAKLLRQKFLVQGSYSNVRVNPDIQDLAVQD